MIRKLPTIATPLFTSNNGSSVETNAHAELLVRAMTYLEGEHITEDVQSHVSQLTGVPHLVRHRQSAGHHVGVSYGLHLINQQMFYYVT